MNWVGPGFAGTIFVGRWVSGVRRLIYSLGISIESLRSFANEFSAADNVLKVRSWAATEDRSCEKWRAARVKKGRSRERLCEAEVRKNGGRDVADGELHREFLTAARRKPKVQR